jgi:hypothetical protein
MMVRGRGTQSGAGLARIVFSLRLVGLGAALVAAWWSPSAVGAGYRTANFVVEAPTPDQARKIGEAAEQYRHTLAVEWTGSPLPRWSRPCPITAQVAPHLGAGGATSFVFDKGEVFNWTMTIQGSEERILDSVLPHEITHTIFASYFRRPLPRWADEGACTTVEHPVERARQHKMLIEFLTTGRGIAFPEMFAMREYPPDVLPLYSQGYSLARFLIERGGRHKYVAFVGDGLKQGCPAPPAALAAATPVASPAAWTPTARGQSPDPQPVAWNPASDSGPVATSAARSSIYSRAGAVRR